MNLDRLHVVLAWPHPMLFPNSRRGSFRKFQPFIKQARLEGLLAAKSALGRNTFVPPELCPVRVTFVAPDRRKRDWDGLAGAIKHQMDGIASAVGVDDGNFRPVTLEFGLDKERKGFVLVELG